MKCDHIRTRTQSDTPFFPNMLNNGNVEVCLKEDVDKAIAELKGEILNLKAKNIELQSFYDLHGNVDNYIDKLKAENTELKQKLESVQASMYCDVVDANMEVRRLKRALWLMGARLGKMGSLAYHNIKAKLYFLDDAEGVKWALRKREQWEKVESKCLKKAEEYK